MYMAMMQNMMSCTHPTMRFAMMQQVARQACIRSAEQLQLLQEWQQQRLACKDKVVSSKHQHGEGEDTKRTSCGYNRTDENTVKFPPRSAATSAITRMHRPGPVPITGTNSAVVEAFLGENRVDPCFIDRLRVSAPHRQLDVTRCGPAWNPSLTLKSRTCRVEHDYGSVCSGSASAIHDEQRRGLRVPV